MKITIRIYRTHDFDLMALHCSGALGIGMAIKKAVIAYYNGEKFTFDVTMSQKIEPSDMPLVITTSIVITERDSAGITEWLSGFRLGYRNCCLKNILRHYLEDPGIACFRDDATKHELFDLGAGTIVCRPRTHTNKAQTGDQWLQDIANQKPQKKDPKKLKKISHALDYLDEDTPHQEDQGSIEQTENVEYEEVWPETTEVEGVQEYDSEMLNTAEENMEEENVDDDFDAFAAFQKIRGG